MDVFNLHKQIVNDYAQYANSFVPIQDNRIAEKVKEATDKGAFWPDPLLQLNPNFASGAHVDELVSRGELHQECKQIFRVKKTDGIGKQMRLYKHQLDALRVAQQKENYVLTTGTGSGKSLAYIVPIVDYVLRNPEKGRIKAIIVYPMNALANSQEEELKKFLSLGYPQGEPVTFAKYTGQESSELRAQIKKNPPDILLTNYVMLELMLTRTYEAPLIAKAHGLNFLVLDELHTYRGRQGADVALLIRRLRNRLNAADTLQCIGTSATLSTTGTIDDQKREVAAVASELFGTSVHSEHVIGETLKRATAEPNFLDQQFQTALISNIQEALAENAPTDYTTFISRPLSQWIESVFGVTREPHANTLIRSRPRSITGQMGAAKNLSKLIDIPQNECAQAIINWLLAGYRCEPNPDNSKPAFAFRLHQFISPGDTMYASLEMEEQRYLTVRGQQFVPHSQQSKRLYPLVFCRECGQEYYVVHKHEDEAGHALFFEPREFRDDHKEELKEPGYLYVSDRNPWPENITDELERLPDEWLEEGSHGLKVHRNRVDRLPQSYYIAADGQPTEHGQHAVYVRSKFLFCLSCGVSYDPYQGDFGKLAPLSSEGRSSATSIISMSVIRNLIQEENLSQEARKLLSFTDNRQDASLQAGHFNDFVLVGMMRGALYRAVEKAGTAGLEHDEVATAVFKALNLPVAEYAQTPDVKYQLLEETNRALIDSLGYRLYLDLRRGWRVTSPNLEQTGLLKISYTSVKEISQDEDLWQKCHAVLTEATPASREQIMIVLLDYMRRELAISVDYLKAEMQNRIQQRNNRRLRVTNKDDGTNASIWALDEQERFERAAILFPRSRQPYESQEHVFVSARGGFGQYLRRQGTFSHLNSPLSQDDAAKIIPQLLEVMAAVGVVEQVVPAKNEADLPGYRLNAATIRWHAGNGTESFHDPIRTPQRPQDGGRPNPFFVNFYREISQKLGGLEAREHTAQVNYKDREVREARFRKADLPILYCSPTMELGVDIAELNVVNMRNVPPTPANYAQRSGRAGRSGQPALVITYCSAGSPHDQYFFRRPEQMVSGQVAPPRLDLANEDLIRAHVQAIWLAESGLALGQTLSEILDVEGSNPTLDLHEDVEKALTDPHVQQKAHRRSLDVLSQITGLDESGWYHADWLSHTLSHVDKSFEDACNRWIELYRSASEQAKRQNEIILDASRDAKAQKQARSLRGQAEQQLKALTTLEGVGQSDFYSYRYFATEGFLPGYSFPRLPVRAYIRGGRDGERGNYISRARFLAIAEFGPRAIVYHEGSRYLINEVMLPAGGDGPQMKEIRLCGSCGYLHQLQGDIQLNNCERCGQEMGYSLNRLMHLRNVSTVRRRRINSDEEERLRMGYNIRTGVRFSKRQGQADKRTAEVKIEQNLYWRMEYGQAAELWRINLGWARSSEDTPPGFVLDLERGRWAQSETEKAKDASDPLSNQTARVIPYVEDQRNCLLIEPITTLEPEAFASVQAAIKRAIEATYQLEDNELAAEALPDRDNRQIMLFYEAAEGGAGILRRLIDEPQALAQVARMALDICHYDEDGHDLNHAPGHDERCEAACYDCLLSYSNQREHDLLKRNVAQPILSALLNAVVETSPSPQPRSAHMQELINLCESELEKSWLHYLEDKNLRLPDGAQKYIQPCDTRADFVYGKSTIVYIDGPDHDSARQQSKDEQITMCLQNLGATVIRFGYDKTTWGETILKYNHLFGGEA